MIVTVTFKNLRKGFVSAWDRASVAFDANGGNFASLTRDEQIAVVRAHVSAHVQTEGCSNAI
jgi:hypothetical protein